MINLHQMFENMTTTGWGLLLLGVILWTAATYYMGVYSEKKWGDRESGALIGFFVPGLFFVIGLFLIQ